MRLSSGLRAALVALLALTGAGLSSSAAYADCGSIQIWELKGGWFIGASGGGRLTHLPWAALSPFDWWLERGARLRRLGNEAVRPCEQHPVPI